MHRIDPVTEESCRAYCGKPVLIFLRDGTEIYGVMSRVENGQLFLGDFPGSGSPIALTSKKSKAKNRQKSPSKAEVNAFIGPYPFIYPYGYGAVIALELATIALLFAFLI